MNMLYCPKCEGPLIEQGDYLICTLCCAVFIRTENKIRFFRQFSGNKYVREFMEVLRDEVFISKEAEAENVPRREGILEQADKSLS